MTKKWKNSQKLKDFEQALIIKEEVNVGKIVENLNDYLRHSIIRIVGEGDKEMYWFKWSSLIKNDSKEIFTQYPCGFYTEDVFRYLLEGASVQGNK